jgi:CheY-like chemotaxis protein
MVRKKAGLILFVDDESDTFARDYLNELKRSGFRVRHEKDVDSALEFLEKSLTQIVLLILDVMMPPGEAFKEVETDEGRTTGIPFFEAVRAMTSDLPVVILTNITRPGVRQRFLKEDRCWFYQKFENLPHELVEKVGKIMSQLPKREERVHAKSQRGH